MLLLEKLVTEVYTAVILPQSGRKTMSGLQMINNHELRYPDGARM